MNLQEYSDKVKNMITGRLERIDFKKYESPYFDPYLKNDYNWKTCGSSCISTICGIKAGTIEKYLPKNQKDWSNRALVNFLLNKNYTVIQITRRNITNTYWENEPLTPNHVLICNLELDRFEASWLVSHNLRIWHNFVEEDFTPLTFVRKPIQNIFLVWHKKWTKPQNYH